MRKKQLYWTLVILLMTALLALSWWGWSKMGLAALQSSLGFC